MCEHILTTSAGFTYISETFHLSYVLAAILQGHLHGMRPIAARKETIHDMLYQKEIGHLHLTFHQMLHPL